MKKVVGNHARKTIAHHIAPYRVESGRGFDLKSFPTAPEPGLSDKSRNGALLKECGEKLSSLQERLHAEGRWSLLLILQGMDASGKDGAIKNVMSGVDPQGVDVTSFKTPTGIELEHDFLWRCNQALPRRGRIGIFNRSYYEEVVAVRVYPQFLEGQRLPHRLVGKRIWSDRLADISAYENYLGRNGIVVRKIFLNISRNEQRKRLLARIEDPDKIWKFSPDDLRDRRLWPEFMSAYEEAIRATASAAAPWFVVPADDKSYARLTVARIAIDALDDLNLAFPTVSGEKERPAKTAAAQLAAEEELGKRSRKAGR